MAKHFSPPQSIEDDSSSYGPHWLQPYQRFGQLLLIKTVDRAKESILELITQWVLRDTFYLIVAGEWLPNHDDLRYAVYKYTPAFDELLERLILSRPFTCLQLLDLLIEAERQKRPVLILDFLHLFYDQDVDLALRSSTLEQCCQYIRRLSLSTPVALLIPSLPIEDYRRFFPFVASIADEIIESENPSSQEVSQGQLF